MHTLIRHALPLSILAAGLLSGCQTDPATAPREAASAPSDGDARQRYYVQELIALKASAPDQKSLEAGNLALLAKYGYPLPETGPEPAEAAPPAPALAKSAAVQTVQVKSASGTKYRTYQNEVVVQPNAELSLFVFAFAPVDPFIVAYYRTSGAAVRYVLANDDSGAGTLHSYGKWLNNTGSPQTVIYTVFAALNTARGLGDITVHANGTRTYTSGIRVGGTVQYENDVASVPPAGCNPVPLGSEFDLKVNSGTNWTYLLAYNASSSTGIIMNTNSTTFITAASDWIPSGTAKPASGTRNFVLSSRPGTSSGSTVSGGYTYVQRDKYDCN